MNSPRQLVSALVLVAILITGMVMAYFENAHAVAGMLGLSAVFTLAGLLQ